MIAIPVRFGIGIACFLMTLQIIVGGEPHE